MATLSKNQLRLIATARGLTVDMIREHTDIPNQSLMVLMNDVTGKDHASLISDSTLKQVMTLLGVKSDVSGIRDDAVIEWSPNKQIPLKNWKQAITTLRKQLFSVNIECAEIISKRSIIRREYLVCLHDRDNNLKIAFTNVSKKLREFILDTFGAKIERTMKLHYADFVTHSRTIRNGVFRVTQFLGVIGGQKFKYDWSDVQAASKEFNFTPDELIQLMVDTTHNALSKPKQEAVVELAEFRTAVGG